MLNFILACAHLADNNVFNNRHCIAKSVIPHSVIYYLMDKVGLALLRLSSPMSNKNKHHSVIRIYLVTEGKFYCLGIFAVPVLFLSLFAKMTTWEEITTSKM